MQVFKVFFKVLNKKKTALLIYIFTYLAITLVLSSVVTEKEEESFSSVSLAVAIENRDQGKLGDVLAAYLEGRHQRVEMPEGREELQDAMYYKTLDYVLAIPEDFTEQMVAGAGGVCWRGRLCLAAAVRILWIMNWGITCRPFPCTLRQGMAWKRLARRLLP